ncbi:universal stress protein [Nocardioides pantholopis]|uniref:universal stress protein n=1 Tax=Nocardioides pantholopis TaxID=2483798 RepID=UPI000F08072A|nr:universal stress protein [Nocardioides pantholopis]
MTTTDTTDINLDVIHPGSIVVGLDDSEQGQEALTWAARQAVLEGRRLAVVHAVEPMTPTTRTMMLAGGVDPGGLEAQMLREARAQAATTATSAADLHPGLEVVDVVRMGDPRDLLLAAAHRASLLVVGSRGRGPLRSLLLGSVSVAVAKHAVCPVVVLRPERPEVVRRGVLVGADGTERSLPALEFAYRHAATRGLPLTVMHCFWDVLAATSPHHVVAEDRTVEDLRVLLSQSVAGMSERYPDVEVHLELARGLVDEALATGAEEMDLVVVGWHDADPVTSFLYGSVAPSVLERARCAVAIIPDETRR